MKRLRQTGLEFVLLGVAGLVVAVAANGVRGKGSIEWSKNYFYIPDAPITVPPPKGNGASGNIENVPPKETEHAKHSFQVINYDEVAALLEDPDTQSGLNVFIDARNDHSYEDGHIPGAVQCDPYQMAQYWDNISPLVEGAMKIVVYCGGGDCDDSIFMCRELLNMDIPKEAIYLYEGGWKEWTAKDGTVETGRNE